MILICFGGLGYSPSAGAGDWLARHPGKMLESHPRLGLGLEPENAQDREEERVGEDQAGEGCHHFDDLVGELPKDDDDPGRCVVVLRSGPYEADCAQHLDDEAGELGETAQTAEGAAFCCSAPTYLFPQPALRVQKRTPKGTPYQTAAEGSTKPPRSLQCYQGLYKATEGSTKTPRALQRHQGLYNATKGSTKPPRAP